MTAPIFSAQCIWLTSQCIGLFICCKAVRWLVKHFSLFWCYETLLLWYYYCCWGYWSSMRYYCHCSRLMIFLFEICYLWNNIVSMGDDNFWRKLVVWVLRYDLHVKYSTQWGPQHEKYSPRLSSTDNSPDPCNKHKFIFRTGPKEWWGSKLWMLLIDWI